MSKIKEIFNCINDVDGFSNMTKNMVFVQWDDHYSGDHGWANINRVIEAHKNDSECTCQTTGFLIYEDTKFIKVAITINDSMELSTVFTILKSTITERIDFEI